jgi:hypothetical protein
MYLVFKDKYEDIKWEGRFKVESLEAYAEKMNKSAMAKGSKRETHFVDSPRSIMVTEWDGSKNGSYHCCTEEKPYQLI